MHLVKGNTQSLQYAEIAFLLELNLGINLGSVAIQWCCMRQEINEILESLVWLTVGQQGSRTHLMVICW